MIKFPKHKKEYKALKSTTNLKFIDLKIQRHRFNQLKIHRHKIYRLKILRHKTYPSCRIKVEIHGYKER